MTETVEKYDCDIRCWALILAFDAGYGRHLGEDLVKAAQIYYADRKFDEPYRNHFIDMYSEFSGVRIIRETAEAMRVMAVVRERYLVWQANPAAETYKLSERELREMTDPDPNLGAVSHLLSDIRGSMSRPLDPVEPGDNFNHDPKYFYHKLYFYVNEFYKMMDYYR